MKQTTLNTSIQHQNRAKNATDGNNRQMSEIANDLSCRVCGCVCPNDVYCINCGTLREGSP